MQRVSAVVIALYTLLVAAVLIAQPPANYLAWKDVQTGPTTYNWAPIDNLLNDVASRGHQTVFRIYVDWKSRKIAKRSARTLADKTNIVRRKGMSPIRVLIEATLPKADFKQKSRWVCALEYVYSQNISVKEFQQFIRRHGGFAGCATERWRAYAQAAKSSAAAASVLRIAAAYGALRAGHAHLARAASFGNERNAVCSA